MKIKLLKLFQDFKLKCSICNEKFKTLNELCTHKDNESCKENFDHILTVDTLNDNDEADSVDEELDEDTDDLEMDLDINLNNQNIDQEKKRTRRKYTKNKNNLPSNLICECKLKFIIFLNFNYRF